MTRLARTAGLAVVLTVVALIAFSAFALGADPSADPSAVPAAVLEGGDLRSEGAGPGLVGNPLLILGAVVLLGLATAAVTVVIVRFSRRD